MDTWLWVVLGTLAGVGAGSVAIWWLVQRYARPPEVLVKRLSRLTWRERLGLVWALICDRRVPLSVRLLVPLVMLYLAMPLDIIPDFIPVIGVLDDVLLVLVALRLILRAIPPQLLEEHLASLEVRRTPGTAHPSSGSVTGDT